jgi:hypothetical protein
MNRPITKSDLCWVIIKSAGVYMIYTALAGFFGAYVGWMSVKDIYGSSRIASLRPLKTMVWVSLVPLALGTYLVVSGRTIHRCLMSVPSGWGGAARDGLDPETGFSDSEQKAFEAWLEQHPEIRSRALSDQIALFRDAQRSDR